MIGSRVRYRSAGPHRGGGGGGGCGVVLATIYDDNFDCGSSIDTAGIRFSGARAWSYFNAGGAGVASSFSQSGGLLQVNSGGYQLQNPRAALQALPSGDFRIRAKFTTTKNDSSFPMHGIMLRESATDKILIGGLGATNLGVSRYSNVNTLSGGYSGGTASNALTTVWAEWERVGSTLTFKVTENATDGNDLMTPLGSSNVVNYSQTTDFTTAPDQFGPAVQGDTQTANWDWIARLA